jgi:hypothetical protein
MTLRAGVQLKPAGERHASWMLAARTIGVFVRMEDG